MLMRSNLDEDEDGEHDDEAAADDDDDVAVDKYGPDVDKHADEDITASFDSAELICLFNSERNVSLSITLPS